MLDIVLDENIYIKAIDAECSEDPSDRLAANVVTLLQNRHRWIMSRDVLQAYRRQYSRRRCRGSGPTRLITSLTEVTFDQSRSVWLDKPAIVEGKYHRKDQHMVAAAAAVKGCCLITTDMRLARALELAGIPTRYGFRVTNLEAAQSLLAEQPDRD